MAEYIGRDAAIKAAKHAWTKGLEPSQYIEALPAADVAPVVHGAWQVPDRFKACSVCGYAFARLCQTNTAPTAGRKWTARERTAGMAKQSGYLQRREAELDATFNAGAAMAMQFAMDTLQMALHQTEGWGYDRIMRITHNWVAVQREYKPARDCRNPEADVRQVHMDRVLAEIIGGKAELIRFPDRYPNAKKIKYGR